jgi:hypothetical protein
MSEGVLAVGSSRRGNPQIRCATPQIARSSGQPRATLGDAPRIPAGRSQSGDGRAGVVHPIGGRTRAVNIFLLWRELGSPRERIDPGAAATRLHGVFSPFFDELADAESRSAAAANLVSLDVPVGGFKAPAQASDGSTWAYAPQYPVNAACALADAGIRADGDGVLPALGRALEAQPRRLLRELAPPFSLIWGTHDSGAVFVQTDGLGHAMLYEYRDETMWAVTNRPFALSALGVRLEPDAEQWAVRSVLGWFPGSMTGFRNLRYPAPGTQLRVTADGVHETRHDVLAEWVGVPTTTRQASLDLARDSLVDLVGGVRPLVERPYISLSGGWDSRAVLAVVASTGVPFDARVRGPEDHRDVMSARRLAAAGGFDIEARHSASLPPADHESCRAQILRALIWQAGGRNAHKHKTFQVEGRFRDGGSVGFSGQHGEIGRSTYVKKARAGGLAVGTDDGLLEHLTRKSAPFIRASLLDYAREAIRDTIGAANRYALTGLRRWDFFYLFERTRRWAATAQAAKPGFSITPFLNPSYIRAAFSMPDEDMTGNPFHRHIVESLQPSWAAVPYANDLAEAPSAPAPADREGDRQPRWQRNGSRRFYDTGLYWEDVARPILAGALNRDGFWTEVFDPSAARHHWRDEPDELAVVCLLPEALALAAG